jgi:TetR/AcrR family transcriptional regulator, transcriptional repressor for nem operon
MMPIMPRAASSRPAAAEPGTRKQQTHDRIVREAAALIRASGYHGTGVADIMKAAGLTHGGFYAHFPSRDALLAEAHDQAAKDAVQALQSVVDAAPPQRRLHKLVEAYLGERHADDIAAGCPVAALGSELPRQSAELRATATRRIKDMVDLVARLHPEWGQVRAHHDALATVSAMVGALILARAVDDPRLADELRQATRDHLLNPTP